MVITIARVRAGRMVVLGPWLKGPLGGQARPAAAGDADRIARMCEAERIKREAEHAKVEERRRRRREQHQRPAPVPPFSGSRPRVQLLRDGFVCGPRFPLSSLKDASGELHSAAA
jgi:hypothetical protein